MDSIGLYDSATGESLYIEKRWRHTTSERDFILDYTTAKRGRIVRITQPYARAQDWGSSIHFFVDELDAEVDASDYNNTLRCRVRIHHALQHLARD
jgi:hypothetical protein